MKFQMLTLKRSALILAATLFTAACGNSDTASESPFRNPGGRGDESGKPGEPNARYLQTESSLALFNIAVQDLNRSSEIVLKKEKAQSLLIKNNCQKIKSEESGSLGTIEITTTPGSCRTAGGGNWDAVESISFEKSADGFRSLRTSQQGPLTIVSSAPERDFSIRSRTEFRPSNRGASPLFFEVENQTTVTAYYKDGTQTRSTVFVITLEADVQIARESGQISQLFIRSGQVDVDREDSVARQMTFSRMSLSSEDGESLKVDCGRLSGRAKYMQSVSSRVLPNATQKLGSAVFDPKRVSLADDESATVTVASCASSFKMIETDLKTAADRIIRNLKATGSR